MAAIATSPFVSFSLSLPSFSSPWQLCDVLFLHPGGDKIFAHHLLTIHFTLLSQEYDKYCYLLWDAGSITNGANMRTDRHCVMIDDPINSTAYQYYSQYKFSLVFLSVKKIMRERTEAV